MKNKQNKKLVAVAIALFTGVFAVTANNDAPCVASGAPNGSCGTSQKAKAPACVEIVCNDTSHACVGRQSDFYCYDVPYTSSCTRIRYFYDANLGCTSTIVESGSIPAQCRAIGGEIGGC
jgi:hypothetical protein